MTVILTALYEASIPTASLEMGWEGSKEKIAAAVSVWSSFFRLPYKAFRPSIDHAPPWRRRTGRHYQWLFGHQQPGGAHFRVLLESLLLMVRSTIAHDTPFGLKRNRERSMVEPCDG